MAAQLVAIALVISCGIGVFVGMRSTMHSLERARASYYAEQRFGHVFARLVRAPERIAQHLQAIPGVESVETRVVTDVTLDLRGVVEPLSGRLISLPTRGLPRVNGVALRRGRMPRARNEVLVGEAFAEARELRLGDRLGAIIDGHRHELRVAGIALSPEYTFATAPGSIFPDDSRFGVIWADRRVLAAAADMEGAFNDVSLRVASPRDQGSELRAVRSEVDRILERYGGVGAIDRSEQPSAFFLANELAQLDTMTWFLPTVFLVVAGFLLNVIVGRIIAGQRSEIAALKAFGYRDREIGGHFAKLVGVVLLVGVALGLAFGTWMGSGMVGLYGQYYRFPKLPFALSPAEVLVSVALATTAAAAATSRAILQAVRLPPAEALRPEAPAAYRATIIERLGLQRLVPPAARIVLREIERQPGRFLLTGAGIALATGLTVVNTFTFDSVSHLLNLHFGLNQREDLQLSLSAPRTLGALASIESLPGVAHAEPLRSVAVRLRAGSRSKSTVLTGYRPSGRLSTLLDRDLREVPLPAEGLVLSRKLAELLDLKAGSELNVEVREGRRRVADLRVARIVETFVGTGAYMSLAALGRLLQEAPSMTGARVLVDADTLDELYAAVQRTPRIAGISSRDEALRHARAMMDQNLGTMLTFTLGFSLVMAFGVLYNAARITLAERARELASLRVLGFHRREVSAMLLGELALLVLAAIPIGLVTGWVLAAAMTASPGFDTEQFRLPLIVAPATYALAALTVLVAASASGWHAWRMLDRFDIVEVLKTRD